MARIPLNKPKSVLRTLRDGTIYGEIAFSVEPLDPPKDRAYIVTTPVSILGVAFERKTPKGGVRVLDVRSGDTPVFVLRD
jgi:hypothetical protein